MDITWLGHACFRVKGREAAVITDPFSRSLGLSMPRQTAEVVTVSHDSPYHSSVDAVTNDPRIVRGPGEYEVSGVMIAGVATAGERDSDGRPGRNTAYAITVDDLTVCHLGSLGKTLSTEQLEALKDPDVLLMPVGGPGSLTPAEVVEVISQLEPKLVVPMQYALPGVQLKLEPVERFCREMGVQELRFQPRLSVTRSSLPDETTVALLEASAAKR